MALSDSIEHARKQVDTSPTDGQIKAGNYKKGHFSVKGMVISIENPRGTYRCGTDKDGHKWRTLMHYDYGYFVKTVGKDGDAIDVFIGPNLDSDKVFCVDQVLNGKFDETKVMLGFDSEEEAKKAYLSNYEKGWKGFGDITEVDIKKFKKWLYDGYRQRKAFADYTRLYETEEKFSIKDKIMLREEEYNQQAVIYTGNDCKGVFNYLCDNGFSRYDLGYDPQSNTVSVTAEQDRNNDGYADEVIRYAKSLVDKYLGGEGYGNVMEKIASKTPLSESEMRVMVKKVIRESLESIMVTYMSPSKGNQSMAVKSIQDAQRAIPSDATYFDITKGSNSSEEENLVSWGGKNGYWDNKTNPDFPNGTKVKPRELDRIMNKRKF